MIRTACLCLFFLHASNHCIGQTDTSAANHNSAVVDAPFNRIQSETERADWSYAKLTADSDLIVIGKLISKSESLPAPESKDSFGENSVRQISNRILVLTALKGQSDEEIELMTIEWNPGMIVLQKHDFAVLRSTLLLPNLVATELDGQIIGYGLIESSADSGNLLKSTIEPEYLLFLRKRADGRFDPVTGHRYSRMSVRLLNN